MSLIDSDAGFRKLIEELKSYKFFTIDTEFLRDKTYYPSFCLLQIATPNKSYIVDVLSKNIDIKLFANILEDKNIVKVFHSCKQDIEILLKAVEVMPQNIFDTQIAAAFIGLGDVVSYDWLCKKLLNKKIDKTQRVTDWGKRPLDVQQLDYALNDVIYLVEIYRKLIALLEEQRKTNWAMEYMQYLSTPKYYEFDINEVWKKVNLPQIPKRAKKTCKIIAIWREHKAQELNLPRRRFLKDIDMINIGVYISGVNKTRPSTQLLQNYEKEIIEFVTNFDKMNPTQDLRSKIMTIKQRKLYGLLKSLLSIKANEKQIARHLIARNADLTELVFAESFSNFNCMQGWRYEIYGKFAAQIINNHS